MLRLLKADNGMDIVGQGHRIMVFTAPSVALAVLLQLKAPALVRLPFERAVLFPVAIGLLAGGLLLWGTAVAQLLTGFTRGRLVTTGAYAVCRNPVYSSVALLLLPGISLLAGTWAYVLVSAFLCAGVQMFVGVEERQLLRVFGDEYGAYTRRVSRIVPFVRPRA